MKMLAGLMLLLLVWALPASGQTVVTLPQGGTVTFCETRTQGTYATVGDPWIIGPVTICDRTSKDVDGVAPTLHGCMVNPVPTAQTSIRDSFDNGFAHGFDSRVTGNPYVVALNRCNSFPSSSIAATSSIVFAGSRASVYTQGTSGRYIDTFDVVTVVSSDPGANAFRPPFAGTSKPSFSKSGLRYDVLQDLALVTGQKSLATVIAANFFRGPFVWMSAGTTQGEDFPAVSNWNTLGGRAYSRSVNNGIGEVLTALNTNASDAAKEPLALRVVQAGIDAYGQALNGRTWTAPGGFCYHMEAVGLVAASLLNDQGMMDAFSGTLHPWDYCSTSRHKYVTQQDVDTMRVSYCGSNVTTSTSQCVAFTQAMLGRPQHCDDTWLPNYHEPECSAKLTTTYSWLNNSEIHIALVMRWMSLEEEFGSPAFIDYFYGDVASGATSWGDSRFVQWAITNAYENSCAAALYYDSNGAMQFTCNLWLTYRNVTPTNGSITGGSPPNEPPTITLTAPSSATTVVQTGATIALGGTTADIDGTVSSVTFTATCDASITTGGTVSAWTRTVDLPLNTVCTISGHATDNDADSSADLVVSVLRVSNTCTSLADPFALSGTWTTPNPYCWTRMAGDLTWENNHLRSSTAGRNLYLFNSALPNDQIVTWTVDSLPDSATWIYTGVRGSVSGATYSGMGCTAQNPISYIATFVDGLRTTFHMIDMTTGGRTPWVVSDRASCQVIGQQYCLLKNEIVQGTCQTDGSTTFTSGFGWGGAWGVSGTLDNYVSTAATGGGDLVAPLISVVTPASVIQVAATPYTATAGTASDAVGVVSCVWSVPENPAVGGPCSGTALPATSVSWTVPSIALLAGNNTVQVTVADAAGHTATDSEVINYVPASSVTGAFTYPTAAATWTQTGTLVDLAGTFTAGQCLSVLLTNVSHPNPAVAGATVLATGADTWSARVRLVVGENLVRIDCMDAAAGGGTSKLPLTKTVTATPLRVRR